jgi:hypothetical protein
MMPKLLTHQRSADWAAAESGNAEETRSRDEKGMFEMLLSIHEQKTWIDSARIFRKAYEMDREKRKNFDNTKLKEDIISCSGSQ